MAPKYELEYFALQGRAEIIRLLFHHAGVEFTDTTYKLNGNEDSGDKEWKSVKTDAKSYPLGQLPVLKVDGQVVICQSKAIERYVAKELNLHGANHLEAAVIDQVVDTLTDYMEDYFKIRFKKDTTPDEMKAEFASYYEGEGIKKKMIFFENLLKKNEKGFFVGDSITYADIAFVFVSDQMDKGFLDQFQTLVQLTKRVKDSPRIKSYLAERKTTFLP